MLTRSLAGRLGWQEILLTGLALMFATIPEELPILIAAVLAVGVRTLSRSQVFIKELKAMESLALVDVVLSDKTGTLTMNKLELKDLYTSEGGEVRQTPVHEASLLLRAWASLREEDLAAPESTTKRGGQPGVTAPAKAPATTSTDPFDAAVLEALAQGRVADAGVGGDSTAREYPFESTSKLAGRLLYAAPGSSGELVLFLKGAPECVLRCCAGDHAALTALLEEAAGRGLRQVAYARLDLTVGSEDEVAEVAEWLAALGEVRGATLQGVMCFEDTIRAEVEGAVASLHEAGIRVAMVTGDHPLAATEMGIKAGILSPDTPAGTWEGEGTGERRYIERGGNKLRCYRQ